MLKDRGNKKWIAMMLPEHVAKIRGWLESANDIPEPEHDEFSLNALADNINIAYQAKSVVRIFYWINKKSEIHEGYVVELLPGDQAIRIEMDGFIVKLHLKNMIKLDILN